jgi:hypothetical protein
VSQTAGFRATKSPYFSPERRKTGKKGAYFLPLFAGFGFSLENKAEQKTVDCPLKTPQKGVKKGRRREIVKKNRQIKLFSSFVLTDTLFCDIISNAA